MLYNITNNYLKILLLLLIVGCANYVDKKMQCSDIKTRIKVITTKRVGISIFLDERPIKEKFKKYNYHNSFDGYFVYTTGTKSFLWFNEKKGGFSDLSVPKGFSLFLTKSLRTANIFGETIFVDELVNENSDLKRIREKYSIDYLVSGKLKHFAGISYVEMINTTKQFGMIKDEYRLRTAGNVEFLLNIFDLKNINNDDIEKNKLWMFYNNEYQFQRPSYIGSSEKYLVDAVKKSLNKSVSKTMLELESFLIELNKNNTMINYSNLEMSATRRVVIDGLSGTSPHYCRNPLKFPGKIVKVFISAVENKALNVCRYGYKILSDINSRKCLIWAEFCDKDIFTPNAEFDITVMYQKHD